MKITKFFALLCAVAVGFVACEPVQNGPEPEPKPEPSGKITLSADNTAIKLGESVTFTVTDQAGTDVTSAASFYDNNMDKVSNPFTPAASGNYTIMATIGAESSNNVTITVMAEMPEIPEDPEPSNLKFNHRALVIDHTGVNCGYCPMMTESLLLLEQSKWHGYYNEVTCHAGAMAGGDPANSTAANVLNKMQKPDGYPNVNINFYTAVVGNYGGQTTVNKIGSALDSYLKKDGADVGISMAIDGDETQLYCAAQIKAAVQKEYKVVAWLLESGIYSPNQAGASKDIHRIYNYALRNISGSYSETNVQGESIGVLEVGDTYDCAFQLPITSTKWKWENMGVLVIVSAKDASNRWEVVNSLYCNLSEKSKTYEYIK
jgi:hypothetical protein